MKTPFLSNGRTNNTLTNKQMYYDAENNCRFTCEKDGRWLFFTGRLSVSTCVENPHQSVVS